MLHIFFNVALLWLAEIESVDVRGTAVRNMRGRVPVDAARVNYCLHTLQKLSRKPGNPKKLS